MAYNYQVACTSREHAQLFVLDQFPSSPANNPYKFVEFLLNREWGDLSPSSCGAGLFWWYELL